MTTKVNEERLEISEDGYGNVLLDGAYFSGIGYEHDGTGQLIGLGGYHKGWLHGCHRSWDSSGRLASETYYDVGAHHGPTREWYRDGCRKTDGCWEYGAPIRSAAWSIEGSVTKDRGMLTSDPDFKGLQRDRRRHTPAAPVMDIDVESMDFVDLGVGWRLPREAPLPGVTFPNYFVRTRQLVGEQVWYELVSIANGQVAVSVPRTSRVGLSLVVEYERLDTSLDPNLAVKLLDNHLLVDHTRGALVREVDEVAYRTAGQQDLTTKVSR